MQQAFRLAILLSSILVVALALEATWYPPETVNSAAEEVAAGETPWRYTKYGWQDLRQWRNVQAEVEPAPPAIHPLLWALGVLILSLGAMIWIGDEEPEEKAVLGELRRQEILNLLK